MVDQDARRELISKQLHDMAASKNDPSFGMMIC